MFMWSKMCGLVSRGEPHKNELLAKDVCLFPGFPTVEFLMGLQYAKMEGEGLVHFITCQGPPSCQKRGEVSD